MPHFKEFGLIKSLLMKFTSVKKKKKRKSQVLVAHSCNLIYTEAEIRRIMVQSQLQANSLSP
jgi:hypothetical protein